VESIEYERERVGKIQDEQLTQAEALRIAAERSQKRQAKLSEVMDELEKEMIEKEVIVGENSSRRPQTSANTREHRPNPNPKPLILKWRLKRTKMGAGTSAEMRDFTPTSHNEMLRTVNSSAVSTLF